VSAEGSLIVAAIAATIAEWQREADRFQQTIASTG
jgi:hypothetical protein